MEGELSISGARGFAPLNYADTSRMFFRRFADKTGFGPSKGSVYAKICVILIFWICYNDNQFNLSKSNVWRI
ncbi:hypothetical protein ASD40_31410 [Paenibacillus sp. Root444D2]|nr:hypothetical protein ASD40_31410 [Paenibacillus sp. Root444D2]